MHDHIKGNDNKLTRSRLQGRTRDAILQRRRIYRTSSSHLRRQLQEKVDGSYEGDHEHLYLMGFRDGNQ